MKTLLFSTLLLWGFMADSQYDYFQYFDGADTLSSNSVIFEIDTTNPNNIWQIGPPQKAVFDSPYSAPNVLVTDTLLPYPAFDTSRVSASVEAQQQQGWGIWAFQWQQKLDFGPGDGGILETSVDSGATWINAFYDPNVYNFFGYDQQNYGYVGGLDEGFVGVDTNWRNVWICYDLSWLSLQQDLRLRYTFVSDSTGGVATPNDGWMIDNVVSQRTWVHTINEVKPDQYMEVYPNPADDRINIVTEKKTEFHIIEKLALYDMNGKRVRYFENVPTKYFVDVADLPEGNYLLEIQTNFEKQSFDVIVQH